MLSELLPKLLPLLGLVALGFVAGRKLRIAREHIARLVIYLVGPCVFFFGTATAPLESLGLRAFFLLPLLTWLLGCVVCLFLYFAARPLLPKPGRNLMAFAGADANAGYFGIPAAVAVFGESGFAPAVLISLGFVLFENTLGFFITARGRHTPREAVRRMLRLPTLYAALCGMTLRVLDLPLPRPLFESLQATRGAYTVLGLMLVGLAFEAATRDERPRLNLALTAWTFAGKFLLWPIVTFVALTLLRGELAPELSRGLALASVMPLAANTVAFAQELDTEPEQAALMVLVSTIAAPFWLGLVLGLLGPHFLVW